MIDDVLAYFGLTAADFLGEGGEAQVFGLDDERIVRIMREDATEDGVAARTLLLQEIAVGAQHLPFATPVVLAQETVFGRIVTVEARIPGRSLLEVLKTAQGSDRRALISDYMDVAWQLGSVAVERPYYGEFGRNDAIQTATLQAYYAERSRRSLAGSQYETIDTTLLAAQLGEPPDGPAFVHLDYFAGNVMADARKLTAVLDFGYSTIIADRRMTVVAATAHLLSPRITPFVTEEDRRIALAWLEERDLTAFYQLGEQWMAMYWMFARDDAAAMAWCQSVLDRSL